MDIMGKVDQFRNRPTKDETGDDDLTLTEKIVQGTKRNWKIAVPVAVLLVVAIVAYSIYADSKARANEERIAALVAESTETTSAVVVSESPNGLDTMLMDQQPSLNDRYGIPKDGFIWDVDGTQLSLGEPEWPSEQVAYTYLRALNTLDFTTAEKMSRRSSVIQSYSSFFSTIDASSTDYRTQFNREVYKQMLLSLQVQGLQRSANFSQNKQVYTVTAKVLDLTDKSFWVKDRDMLYQRLRDYRKSEDDSAKGDIFLYQYVIKRYQDTVRALNTGIPIPDPVPMRTVQFELTLEKFPAQASGWLISIDNDLDLICRYAEGKTVVDYVNGLYSDWLQETIEKEREEEARQQAEAQEEAARRQAEEQERHAAEQAARQAQASAQ